MRSFGEARERWQVTIDSSPNLAELRLHVIPSAEMNPCAHGLRSVCWKIFLLFRSTDTAKWSAVLSDTRAAYSSLRDHLLKYVNSVEDLGSTIDPLDDDRNSPWNTLRKDEELRAEILLDVERCMPEEPYFRQSRTQSLMLDVLFIFCKLNQDVGYRQGMHELLAPILWVLERDALDPADEDNSFSSTPNEKLMVDVLNASYVEHDAFTLFALVMQTAKSFYELGEPDKRSSVQSTSGNVHKGTAPIVARSKEIHELYLANVDPELAAHLTEIEILPQIFLIRWIRLLFGREFPFNELLGLWDTLFAEDPALDLVDLICVSMLLRIRWQLIIADYSTALTLLLKYPTPGPTHGPQTFVEDAVYLKDNLDVAGGSKIIAKYGEQPPSLNKSRLSFTATLSPQQNTVLRRSPLPSPSSFLRQQGGVGALLQGAAKDVFERGEKLGINKAVRDAMGEVKKNMEGLAAPPGNFRKLSEVSRWSLDEGRSIPAARKSLSAMETRNRQLGLMLEEALKDLRKASASAAAPIDSTSMDAIDIAVAKIQFVQVYLADSTMPLPSEEQDKSTALKISPTTAGAETPPKPASPAPVAAQQTKARQLPLKHPRKEISASKSSSSIDGKPLTSVDARRTVPSLESPRDTWSKPIERPQAPVPTRSTLAQSSFAWMLESEEPGPVNTPNSTKSKTPNTFGHSRKPTSGSSREKAAFLFGEETDDSMETPTRMKSATSNPDEGFDLEPMKGQNAP